MVESSNQIRAFQFGDWLIEPHLNRIKQGDTEKQLERKAMDVLEYLLEHAGETVPSSELLHEIWADRIAEEGGVEERISRIRRNLGDDPQNPQYIENIPKRGYRTLARVTKTAIAPQTNPELLSTLQTRTPPFPAYTGDEPYVFVCYSHNDRDLVYPELIRLREAGIKLWYDEGISPGKAWTEELAIAINGCTQFLYFVSPRSVQSRNCLNELEYALNANKALVAVHLEHTVLSEGLQLSIGRTQALFKYELTHEDYDRKLFNTLATVAAPPLLQATTHAQHSSPSVATVLKVVFAMGVGLAVTVAGFLNWPDRATEFPQASQYEKHFVVIPFQVLDGDPRTQRVAAGLVVELISKLMQLQQFHRSLWVVSAAEVRNQTLLTPSEARRAYGVTLAVTGSIRRSQSGYEVTVSLVDTNNGRLLSSIEEFDESAVSIVLMLARVLDIVLPPGARDILVAGGTSLPSANALYLEGYGYLRHFENEENVDQAIELFIEALDQDQNFVLALVGLGEAYLHKYELSRESQWVQEANKRIEAAIGIKPDLALVHVVKGKLQIASGQYNEAVATLLKAIELDPANAGAYPGLAQAYKAIGQLDEAESTYQKAIALQPDYWSSHNDLGVFYYQIGSSLKASVEFRNAIELSPGTPRAYTNLGAAYFALDRIEEALSMFERSVAVEPSWEGYSNLGTQFYSMNRYADAIRLYQLAIDLNDGDLRLWRNLGAAYRHIIPTEIDQVRAAYTRCIELADEELAVNPRDTEMIINIADCHSWLGHTELAIDFLTRGLENCPVDIDLIFIAGEIYEELGDREAALGWIGAAVCQGLPLDDIDLSPELAELRADPLFADAVSTEADACTGFRSCGIARENQKN